MSREMQRKGDQQRYLSSPTFGELLLSSNHLTRSSDFNPDYKEFLRAIPEEEVDGYLQELGTQLLALKVYYERHREDIAKELGVDPRVVKSGILNCAVGQVQEHTTAPSKERTVRIYLRSWGQILLTYELNLNDQIELDYEDLSSEFIDKLDLNHRKDQDRALASRFSQ